MTGISQGLLLLVSSLVFLLVALLAHDFVRLWRLQDTLPDQLPYALPVNAVYVMGLDVDLLALGHRSLAPAPVACVTGQLDRHASFA